LDLYNAGLAKALQIVARLVSLCLASASTQGEHGETGKQARYGTGHDRMLGIQRP
jgi:hypothetical protein